MKKGYYGLSLITSLVDTATNNMTLFAATEDEAVIGEVQKLMEKVEEMRKQRDGFEQQFRDQVHKDDITSALVTREDGNQQVE